jgi:hypothetical protein
LARENSGWGYDRIVGALSNLSHHLSDQTRATSCGVRTSYRRRNVVKRPLGKISFRRHMDVLAGTHFFTVEVLTWRGLVTYYVLFFVELESRRVWIGGITRHPDECWMKQVARNATLEEIGDLKGRYVLHDRDEKFCRDFRDTLAAGGVTCVVLPKRSKGQYKTGKLGGRKATMSELWNAALAA